MSNVSGCLGGTRARAAPSAARHHRIPGPVSMFTAFLLVVFVAIALMITTILVVIFAWNVRQPSWVGLAIGLLFGALMLWLSDLGTGVGSLVLSTIGVSQIAAALVGLVRRLRVQRSIGTLL